MRQNPSLCFERAGRLSGGRLLYPWVLLLLFFFFGLPVFLAATDEKPTQVPTSSENFNVEVTGSIGGEQITAIAAQGNYVIGGYSQALAGQQLTIWDVSDSEEIRVVGQTAVLPYNIYQISLQGNYAYIAAGEAGVHVIDISSPQHPVEIGSYTSPAPARRITLAGSYAYVAASHAGMRVLDISQPSQPVEVSFIDTPGEANEIAVSGNYAYIADGYTSITYYLGGLRIIDVTNPLAPQEVSFLEPGVDISRIEIRGNYAYLLAYETFYGLPEVQKIDISDPLHPIEELRGYGGQYGTYDITIIGSTIYLTGGSYDDYLRILDATDLHTIRNVNDLSRVNDMAVMGEYAYISDMARGLQIMDVSNPHFPQTVDKEYRIIPPVYDIAFDANYTFLAAAGYGMQIVDLDSISKPIEISHYGEFFATDIEIANDYAYLPGSSTLDIVDVSDPLFPRRVSYYQAPVDIKDVVVRQNELYIASWWRLDIVNISNPITPTITGVMTPTTGVIVGLDIQGNYAYLVGQYGAGLSIVDITDPGNPYEIGFLHGNGEDVVVMGNVALIAAGEDGLRLVDVSDPTQPVETAVYSLPGFAQSVLIHNHYLYVSAGTEGVFIFDISDLPHPILLGHYKTPYTSHVIVNENLIYAVDGHHIEVQDDPRIRWEFAGSGTIFVLFQAVRSARMTPQTGGLLAYPNQRSLTTTIQIPAGAVTMPTTLVYAQSPYVFPPAGTAVVGHAFDLSAYLQGELLPHFSYSQPVTVTIPYRNADLRVLTDKDDLSVLWYKDGQWREATTSCSPPSTAVLDRHKRLITVPVCQLGQYALTGPTNQAFMPFVFKETE